MNHILTIFKKEFIDTIRDRRTLLTMVFVPLLLLPLILSVTTNLVSSQVTKAMDKDLKVGLVTNNNGAELVKRLKRRKDITILEQDNSRDFKSLIRQDSLDIALEIMPSFDQQVGDLKTGELVLFYNSTDEDAISQRIDKTIRAYRSDLLDARLDSLKATQETITPINVEKNDIYTQKESLGKMAGGFLPYMFVLFCFFGAMYPAIDLFTGEKERGTIETILSVPVRRIQLLLGKMMVVVLTGVTSGVLTILGLYLALRLNPDIPSMITNIVDQILKPSSVLLIVLMMLPLTTFFAGVLIPISIYAKSFKEAQSLIQPMSFVVILPLVIGMMPGIELNFITALVPVLNIALASREIIAGTIDYSLLAMVFASLITFAGIGVLLCVRWFGKEGNILRV
ncbi:MAG: ABC transporter permease [Saprospiraceae bacterium]